MLFYLRKLRRNRNTLRTQLLAFAALSVKEGMTVKEWQRLTVAHPSLSEMIKEAALDCFGKSVHGAVR